MRPRGTRGMRSLRAKLTLANVLLLALGIIAATAVSLMGMRHYLLQQVDAGLGKTRQSLSDSHLTLRQIDSLAALAIIRDQFVRPPMSEQPRPDSLFAVVDARGGVRDRKSVV